MPASSFEQPLTAEAVGRVMTDIMAGRASEAVIRDFLTTAARRGETAEEIGRASCRERV